MKKLYLVILLFCVFTAFAFTESTFVWKDVYHQGFISPHPDSSGKLYFGSDSVAWYLISGELHYFYPKTGYPISADTGTIFYYNAGSDPGWRGYGENGWVKIPSIDTLLPSQIRNYDYVFTVTDTPVIEHDYTNLAEALDTANNYANDSTICLVRVMPGFYHVNGDTFFKDYNIDIVGIGTPVFLI